MSRPELTQRQQKIMMLIGQKKPGDCDAIEAHVRKKTAELSFKIEQVNGNVSSLKDQIIMAEKALHITIGKFLAIAELAEEHEMGKAKAPIRNPHAPKCSKCGELYPEKLPPGAEDGELTCPACTEKEKANAEDSGNAGQPDQVTKEEPSETSPERPEEGTPAQ